MNNKIEKKLTPEQESQLSVYRNKGIEIGLSTEPADRKRAEAGVKKAYELVGLDPPKNFIWCGSPFEGAKKAYELKLRDQDGEQAWNQVRNQVRVQVRNQVGNQVEELVWDQVEELVWDQVLDQVRNQIWNQVMDKVWNQVWNQVWDQVRDRANQWIYSIYGQHESHWLVYYKYFQEVLGVKGLEKIEGLWEVANSAGWWWAFEDTVILTERPCEHHLDEQGRLHNENGMAIRYPDGWGVYCWHGVAVPEQVILTPDSITVKQIDSEENTEVRRVMIERYGHEKYILDSKAKEVCSDEFGVLFEKPFEDDSIKVVKVKNSTPEPDGSYKFYYIPVPPGIQTPREGIAWSFGFDNPEDYCPTIET